MNIKVLYLISIVLVAVVCGSICLGSEVETSRITPDEGGTVYHTDIAIAFMYRHSKHGHGYLFGQTRETPFLPYSIYVIIWNDGHVLLREQPDEDFMGEGFGKEGATFKFQRDILSKENVEELQKKLVSLFRLKEKRIYMARYPMGTPYKVIAINTNQSSVTIESDEDKRDIDTSRKNPTAYRMLHEVSTVDSKAMFLAELYEKWMTAKKEIYAFVEKIDGSKLLPIDVVVLDTDPMRPQLRLYNKEGVLLLQQEIHK